MLPLIIVVAAAGHAGGLWLAYKRPAPATLTRTVAGSPNAIEINAPGRRTIMYGVNSGGTLILSPAQDKPPSWSRGPKIVAQAATPGSAVGFPTDRSPIYEQVLGFPFPELYIIGVNPGSTVSFPGQSPMDTGPTFSSTASKSLRISVPMSFSGSPAKMTRQLDEPIGGHIQGLGVVAVCMNTSIFAGSTIVLFAGVLWTVRAVRRRRGRCAGCGYDLAGLPPHAPCPECGEPILKGNRDEHR